MTESPFRNPTAKHMRLLWDILDLNYHMKYLVLLNFKKVKFTYLEVMSDYVIDDAV